MIAVGDSGDVELIFTAAKGQRGRVDKSATVTCNDNDRANFSLRLRGEMYPTDFPDSLRPLTLSSSRVKWDPNTKTQETKLVLKNVSKDPLRIKPVAMPFGYADVSIPNDEIKPGKTKEIKVRLTKDFTGTEFQKSFTFECTDSAKTRYTVPVQLMPAVAVVTPQKPPSPTSKVLSDTTKTLPTATSGKSH